VMFFDKDAGFREVHRTLKHGGAIPVQRLGLAALQPLRQSDFRGDEAILSVEPARVP
jgi:hypothetical protein